MRFMVVAQVQQALARQLQIQTCDPSDILVHPSDHTCLHAEGFAVELMKFSLESVLFCLLEDKMNLPSN